MKNLSKTIFGALAIAGVSTSLAFAGDVVNNQALQEEGIIQQVSTFDLESGIVTGISNYYINNEGAVFAYDVGDGIDYNVSQGNLEEILAQIENGTFDMTQPFAIFEYDLTKELYLLVWDGSELKQSHFSDLEEETIKEIIVNPDGTTKDIEDLNNGRLLIIDKN